MCENRKTCWGVGCKRPQINASFTIAITLISFGKAVHVQKKLALQRNFLLFVNKNCLWIMLLLDYQYKFGIENLSSLVYLQKLLFVLNLSSRYVQVTLKTQM